MPTSKYVGSISKYSSKYFAEATLIHDVDKAYSKGSRMATEMGGFVERLWGSLTKVYISLDMRRVSVSLGLCLAPLGLSYNGKYTGSLTNVRMCPPLHHKALAS